MAKNKQAYKAVVLAALPGAAYDVHRVTGLSRMSVWRWLKAMHAAGEVHISGWRHARGNRGPFTPIYSPGPGADAKCDLVKQTGAAVSASYYARLKDSGRLIPSRHVPQSWFAPLVSGK